ncbi:MAG TPA: tetratricopeptide repeat protein, partial [Polyangiaceae bacterium]|nr:tetratricopeptide repeat protein [Polyangiaceae bacterium]
MPLGGLLLAGGASAQSAGDAAAAEELFRQAKALIAQGDYEQACPKLAESHRLDPASGTVLTLALCYRAQGKTASAWASFQEALSRAKQDRRPDRERVAQREIAAIEPRLSRLRVRVEPAAGALPGFRLLRDGQPLGPASYGVAVPVDPGGHEVTASAEGHKPFRAEVQVGAAADALEVLVPALEPEPPAPAPPAPTPPPAAVPTPAPTPAPAPAGPRAPAPPEGPSTGQRVLGYGGIGVGSALLGVALYYGYRVKVDSDAARDRCPTSPCADEEGVRRNESARDSATIANV